MLAGTPEEVVALVLFGGAFAARLEDFGHDAHAFLDFRFCHLTVAGEIQQPGEVGRRVLEHQL